jgi:hypothetical protein
MRLPCAFVIFGVVALGCPSGGDRNVEEATASSATAGAGASGGSSNAGGVAVDGATHDGGAACEPPSGLYEASYEQRSGSCGELDELASVSFDSARSGVSTHVAQFADRTVTTEIVVFGCLMRLTQTITADGSVVLRVHAVLSIGSDGRLTGDAEVTRFDQERPACQGAFALTLTRSGAIGSAAATDAGTAAGSFELPPEVTATIEFDCGETILCSAQRGQPLPANPLADCIENTARLLSADESRWPAYLAKAARCESYVACDYVDCTMVQ